MPRQIITIEVEYPLFASDDYDSTELGTPPEHWSIESAFDHYADCNEMWGEFWNRGVRTIQVSPPVYDETDEQHAVDRDTTLDKVLLENGIIR